MKRVTLPARWERNAVQVGTLRRFLHMPQEFYESIEKWKAKEMSVQEILEIYKISESTFFRRLREYSMENK